MVTKLSIRSLQHGAVHLVPAVGGSASPFSYQKACVRDSRTGANTVITMRHDDMRQAALLVSFVASSLVCEMSRESFKALLWEKRLLLPECGTIVVSIAQVDDANEVHLWLSEGKVGILLRVDIAGCLVWECGRYR
jgi:hypothetical protein